MSKILSISLLLALMATPCAAADDFDSFIVGAVTPKDAGWTLTGDDPTGIGAFGVKRLNWVANDGKDRIILFIDADNTSSPADSRTSDVNAGGKNCVDFSSATEFGAESRSYLGWVSQCTLKSGTVMTLKHFAYVKGKIGYKVSRVWRQVPTESALSEWQQTILAIVARIDASK